MNFIKKITEKIIEKIAEDIYLLQLYNSNEQLNEKMIEELFKVKKIIEKNDKEIVFIYLNKKKFSFEKEYLKEIKLKFEEINFKLKKDYYEFYGYLTTTEREQKWINKDNKLKFINKSFEKEKVE